MFGIKFIKAQPNTFILQYKNGNAIPKGVGRAFFYYAPTSAIVAVPMAGTDVPFIFTEVTADFQEVSVQGQVAYRVRSPEQLAEMVDFTLTPNNRGYATDDPERLPQRVLNQVQVLARAELQHMPLRDALRATDELASTLREKLAKNHVLDQLGLEVLDLAILAIKPNPETARALEAEMREQLLRDADVAIYDRRNAAVESERAIRENELNTEIAVENKKCEIREAKIEADRIIQEKRQVMREQEMQGKITIEEKNRDLVGLAVKNQKEEAEVQAYRTGAVMDAFKDLDPRTTQALAAVGMDPAQLIAIAFQNFADNAGKIGNLNIAPELLQELMTAATGEAK
jgi:regulator of protease activity HflC (stomatin/prohibitin superfamily)